VKSAITSPARGTKDVGLESGGGDLNTQCKVPGTGHALHCVRGKGSGLRRNMAFALRVHLCETPPCLALLSPLVTPQIPIGWVTNLPSTVDATTLLRYVHKVFHAKARAGHRGMDSYLLPSPNNPLSPSCVRAGVRGCLRVQLSKGLVMYSL
jgi:hypothetical protein